MLSLIHIWILGIDICGECPELLGEGLEAVRVNDTVNEKLVNFLKDQIFMKNNRAVILSLIHIYYESD